MGHDNAGHVMHVLHRLDATYITFMVSLMGRRSTSESGHELLEHVPMMNRASAPCHLTCGHCDSPADSVCFEFSNRDGLSLMKLDER